MSATIVVDEQTARLLEARAADLGVTVSELIAELARLEGESVASDAKTIGELDRRWARAVAGEGLLPHSDVVRWLRTWGTSRFRPWVG